MNRRHFLMLATSALFARHLRAAAPDAAGYCVELASPVTLSRPKRIVQLGRVRVDDYAWLKPANWKAAWKDPSTLAPAIRAHLKAENIYAEKVLASTQPLQQKLFAEMTARSTGSETPPPRPVGLWLYYCRLASGAQHASWYRQRRDKQGNEELLLDGPARARGRPSFKIVNAVPSADQSLFAWAEDAIGSERYHIYVKDLRTGKIVSNPAQSAYGDFVFSPDSEWIFWIYRDADSRPSKVFRRLARGTEDTLVYQERDPAFFMAISSTASARYMMIRSWNAVSSEVRLISGTEPTERPRLVEPRADGLVYSVEDWNGRFVILTNADGATNFKLMWADESDPARRTWSDWIPYNPEAFITGMTPFRDYFVREERVNANPRLIFTSAKDMSERSIPFPDAAYAVDVSPAQEYGSTEVRYTYQSPKRPVQWIAYDMTSAHLAILKAEAVNGGFKHDEYVVERLHATADDGANVPITVLRHRDTKLDGTAPLMIYGYGAYGDFVQPVFSAALLSLVDRGWIYAIAHVRGGSAEGWDWYLRARQLHKKLSFTDFISCAEKLIREGYASKGRIIGYGLSAGGLLIGAVLNMRPDLFAGVIAEAPFVDMLNTMSDPTHPLVPLTYPDWGNPLASEAVYDYMASYSPYENVTRQPYPPVLATTSVADNRVGFWEPAKWIAKLRVDDASHNQKMLRVEMGGHLGSSGPVAKLHQTALFYAFSIWAVNHHCA
ncbi:MAG: S9 family peptidase [Rhodanobacter sp.]